jgi:hypothetical protein
MTPAKGVVAEGDRPGSIDKSVLAVVEPRRYRDRSTFASSPPRPASSAVASRPIPTIFA